MRNFVTFILLLRLTIAANAQPAQVRNIKGIVTEQGKNSPLPGVSVLIKGSTNGTTTDAKGNYSINVPTGATRLVFAFVGYKTQEVTIGNQPIINVALSPDNQTLSEVVVT